jgi:hypothetical protein
MQAIEPRLDATREELRPPVVVVLPASDQRPLLQTGLALARGLRTRLHACAFHEPGDDLPRALRADAFGGRAPTEADRALHHLIRSATRGSRVAVRRLPTSLGALRSAVEPIHALGAEALLVVGRLRSGEPPETERIQALVEGHPGPVLALVEGHEPMAQVVAVTPREGAHTRKLFARVAYALERSYPVYFRQGIEDAIDLGEVLDQAGRDQLVLLTVPRLDEPGPAALLADPHEVAGRGAVAVVLPAGEGRSDLVVGLLAGSPDE